MTREERIKAAAHVWSRLNDGMFWDKVAKLGLSQDETQEALAVARGHAEDHDRWCRHFGSPSAGGWRRDARDGIHKPAVIIPEEFRR